MKIKTTPNIPFIGLIFVLLIGGILQENSVTSAILISAGSIMWGLWFISRKIEEIKGDSN